MTIGHPIIKFDTLESTNKTAAELLNLSKVQHGAVILAHEQTAGRGQRGRSWLSEPGADLMMSVVLKPARLRADEQFALGKVAALAVAEVVRLLVPGEVRIKWPNDVLVDRLKIAGILIKNEVVGELVHSSVVGMGINANSHDFPEALVATSILLESGRKVELAVLLDHVCKALDRRWKAYEAGESGLAEEYVDQLWARGRWAELLLDDRPVMGRPVDVDRHGRLIVELEGGEVAAYGLDRLRFAPR
ncbi:MAG: biotin--[acetyl-CoA-carboxylase] ligase [Flavobacteriales bacterium]|nr:biotin--[acetyl-CoA-carboxylase] ligase [Flavobacteriales bacterium]